MEEYLASSEFIDTNHSSILSVAKEIAQNDTDQLSIAKNCFEFVRDEIKHSNDFQLNPITCKASNVLKYKTGFCYAKSHLLAALLRANKIPAALCYQRLTIDDEKPPFCLHGLNAVYLDTLGWYKIDPRGNKEGINAQFNPPKEQLAFELKIQGEFNFSTRYAEPLPEVVKVLTQYKTYIDVANHLPDRDQD